MAIHFCLTEEEATFPIIQETYFRSSVLTRMMTNIDMSIQISLSLYVDVTHTHKNAY